MADFLSDDFFSFIAMHDNRSEQLIQLLQKKQVPYTAVTLAGTQHFIVSFSSSAYRPLFTAKTIIAHYDRVSGSPGANDNSAAVYMLVSFAAYLMSQPVAHNVRIIFTGGEEKAPGTPLSGQGSFALGQGMKILDIDDDDIFVLDCCGRGDTLIVSETGLDYGTGGSRFSARQKSLYERTCALCAAAVHTGKKTDRQHGTSSNFSGTCNDYVAYHAGVSEACGGAYNGTVTKNAVCSGNGTYCDNTYQTFGWMSLPVPYGDNAGLAAAGVASQLITVLPHTEAEQLAAGLMKTPGLRQALILKEARAHIPHVDSLIPSTWQLINTPADTPETLSRSAFLLLTRFLNRLSAAETLKAAPVK